MSRVTNSRPDGAVPAAERSLKLLLASVIIIPALVFAGAAYAAYEWHVAQAKTRLARGVDIVYEQSAKVFETLDLVAGRVDELLAGIPDDEIRRRESEFYNRVRAIAQPLEQVQFILAIDGHGHPLVFSALFPIDRNMDYSGREYFQAFAAGPAGDPPEADGPKAEGSKAEGPKADGPGADGSGNGGRTFVSAVLQGRQRVDNTTFLIARRRSAAYRADGTSPPPFDGVIAISTKPAYFVEHFRQIAGPDLDSVALLRGDGAVLARFPGQVDVAAKLLPGGAFLSAIPGAPLQGEYETRSGIDGVRRYYHYRKLPRHDVYVTAGIDRATVLAEWRSTLLRYLSLGLPATAGLVLLAMTALWRTRSEAVAVRLLAERTRELDRVWRTSRDLLAVGDGGGIVRSVNPAWTGALGFTSGEVLGHALEAFVHPDDVPSVARAMARVRQGEIVQDVDLRLRGREGDEHWFSWTWVPEGELFYASGRDVTERRQLADQLRQSQKMEAVGQLTGGIAHDFNNMLTVVIGSLDMIGRRVGPDDARMRRFVEAGMDGARRAALLTSRLLAFARQQPLRPEPADVNALVTGMSELLIRSLGSAVELETVLGEGLWRVDVDHNQLENVLLNLAVNARDAMPEGGQLTIETRNAAWHAGNPPGDAPNDPRRDHVVIAVSDTGCGMTAEVMAKAFEPFFTTKEIGKGTGLGLSQVYGFVTQSGGHVTLHSTPGQGTRVELYLPRVDEDGTGVRGEAALVAGDSGSAG